MVVLISGGHVFCMHDMKQTTDTIALSYGIEESDLWSEKMSNQFRVCPLCRKFLLRSWTYVSFVHWNVQRRCFVALANRMNIEVHGGIRIHKCMY